MVIPIIFSGKFPGLEKESSKARRGSRQSELTKTNGVVPEAEAGSRSVSVVADGACANAAESSIENAMEEGCLVEVCLSKVLYILSCNVGLEYICCYYLFYTYYHNFTYRSSKIVATVKQHGILPIF